MLKRSIVFAALIMFISGCSSTSSDRKEALLPIMRTAIAGIERIALGGIESTEGDTDALLNQVQTFFEFIRSDNPTGTDLAEWETIKTLCHKGIEYWLIQGVVDDNAADSLSLVVDGFDLTIRKYLSGKLDQ